MSATPGRVADSTGNWVDSLAPGWTAPLSAARALRPPDRRLAAAAAVLVVGGARRRSRRAPPLPNLWHVALFFVGAFVMRGAGCTWNDIVDRDLDGRVERTRSRPIPSGQVSVDAGRGVPGGAGAGRPAGAAAVQRLRDHDRHRVAGDRRDLSVHEAHHLLAADRARPRLLVGRADGLGRRRSAGSMRPRSALRRVDRLGDRLRHHLRAPGPRGRRADRRQVDRAAVRRAHQADAGAVLRARRGAVGVGRMAGRRRARVLRSASPRSPRISPGRSGGSTSPIRTSACGCSSRTATPG